MNLNFNDFPWHDANLQSIYIDRQNPGERDVVRILIEWPDENHSSYIEFYDCYALNANMNFGIVACESILGAECILESQELAQIKKIWLKMGQDISNLKCYRINTNSTNSILNIFALGFRLINTFDGQLN